MPDRVYWLDVCGMLALDSNYACNLSFFLGRQWLKWRLLPERNGQLVFDFETGEARGEWYA